jgi:hypothetical protein
MKLVKYELINKINQESKGKCGWCELSAYNYVSGHMIPGEGTEIKLFPDYADAKEYIKKTYGIRIPSMTSKIPGCISEHGDFERVDVNGNYQIQFFFRYNYSKGCGVNLIDIRENHTHYDSRLELVAFLIE